MPGDGSGDPTNESPRTNLGQRQYEGPSPNCVQYHGPNRVLYHELMAKQRFSSAYGCLSLAHFDELGNLGHARH